MTIEGVFFVSNNWFTSTAAIKTDYFDAEEVDVLQG